MANKRYEELKKMLLERRREIIDDTQRRLPKRDNGSVMDEVEIAEANTQEDIELTLRQMKSETLNKINDALQRLEQGYYGNCKDCGDEISGKRLRALPFAIRCKDCQESREYVDNRVRAKTAKRPFLPGTLLEPEAE